MADNYKEYLATRVIAENRPVCFDSEVADAS